MALYKGWDLALTDNGWVLVEGNEKGMFIGFQLPTHQGFRKEFNQICKEVGIKFKINDISTIRRFKLYILSKP